MNSNKKYEVLIFIGSYLPGYKAGGPIRTISNMVERLGDYFDFKIITMDHDLGTDVPYESVKSNSWNKVGNAHVYYLSKNSYTLINIYRLIASTSHDVIYFNSFFNVRFTLNPLLLKKLAAPKTPIIIAPRGEFSNAAYNSKFWKKIPYTFLLKNLGILKNVWWHSSTHHEEADINNKIGNKNIKITTAINLTNAQSGIKHSSETIKINGDGIKFPLNICFLSRISKIKNLDFALHVLKRIKLNIIFNIYGPIEDIEYWDACEKIINEIPKNITVKYHGEIENILAKEVISKNEILFVPSKGENFGHVYIESLSVGVPILVSDKTPWRDLKEKQLGWDIPLNHQDEFIKAIEDFASFNEEKRINMSKNCLNFAELNTNNSESLEMNKKLFLKAIIN